MAEAFPPAADEPSTSVLTWQEKLEKAQIYKTEGNALYQDSNYKAAIGKYHRALLYVKGIEGALQGLSMGFSQSAEAESACRISDPGKAEMKLLKVACYNNLAGNLHLDFFSSDQVMKLFAISVSILSVR